MATVSPALSAFTVTHESTSYAHATRVTDGWSVAVTIFGPDGAGLPASTFDLADGFDLDQTIDDLYAILDQSAAGVDQVAVATQGLIDDLQTANRAPA